MAGHPRTGRHLVRQGADLAGAAGERGFKVARHAADGDARRRRLDPHHALAAPGRRHSAPRSTAPHRASASTAPRSARSSACEQRTLKGMTWSHPRGYDPMVACSALWQREDRRRHRMGQALAAGFRILPGRGTGARLRPDRHRPSACRPDHGGALPRAARCRRPRGRARGACRGQRRPVLSELQLAGAAMGVPDRCGDAGAGLAAGLRSMRRRRAGATCSISPGKAACCCRCGRRIR